MNIRIGRWTVEVYQRAIHITREPDPNCRSCGGSRSGWMPHGADGTSWDWDECPCLDQLRTWRLPLCARRTAHYSTEPF